MDDEHIYVVDLLKCLGSLKLADRNCNNDFRSRIRMAKKRMLNLDTDLERQRNKQIVGYGTMEK